MPDTVTETPLLVTQEGGVVRVTLNRPARRNAMSRELVERFDALLAELKGNRAARVLVITGAGGHFCAGMDLDEAGGAGATPEERLAAALERNRRTGERFAAIAALPQVVIARIEGSAFAGGLGLVCAADIAIATEGARFAAPEARRGLVAAQILPWLVRRMGRSAAARLVLQGAPIDAAAAARAGLVHEVAPDAAALDALLGMILADIRAGAPGALAETKALLAVMGEVAPPGYAEAGARAFSQCSTGAEAAEGIAAFRAKRPASWAAG